MTRSIVAASFTILLVACSSAADQPQQTQAKPAPATTVFDPQLKALQDAKAVEAAQLEAEKKRRQALEDAGG